MTGARPATPGVVIVAAGSGVRLGADRPKALVEVRGRALIAHAVAGVAEAGLPAPVVVYPEAFGDAFHAAVDSPVSAWVVGGRRRRDSVRAGVSALDPAVDVVGIHDAARAFTPPAVLRAAFAAVTDESGVVAAAPAIPVADTLKRVRGRNVVTTVDRTGLVLIQTPQVFRLRALETVLQTDGDDTDELAPLERLVAAGVVEGEIVVSAGSVWASKITYAQDLRAMAALAGADDDDSERSGRGA